MLCCVCSKRALSNPSQAADAPGTTAPMSQPALVCPGLPRSDSPGFSVLDVETERAGGQVAVPVHLGHCECDEACPAPVRLGSNSEVTSLHLPAAGHHTGPPYLPCPTCLPNPHLYYLCKGGQKEAPSLDPGVHRSWLRPRLSAP